MSNRLRLEVMAWVAVAFWGQSIPIAFAQEPPEQNRKELMEALGPPFIVYREKAMDELKVSDEQKDTLMQRAMQQIMETGPFLDSLRDDTPDREKKLNEHRDAARKKLATQVKEVLKPEQQKRLRQVTLQQEGSFALGQDDVRKELKITQEQMQKFMAIVQDLQKRAGALVKEAQSGVFKPEELRPKIDRLRKEHGKKLEAVLTDTQKKQWEEMLGPPFELGD